MSDQFCLPFFCLFHHKVPVTNFFGSVMETIHTDSAYKSLSRKEWDKDKSVNSLTLEEEITPMTLTSEKQTSDSETEVKHLDSIFCKHLLIIGFFYTQGCMVQVEGGSKCPWSTFRNKVHKSEDIDTLVNYGIAIMAPLVAISTWLSRWRWADELYFYYSTLLQLPWFAVHPFLSFLCRHHYRSKGGKMFVCHRMLIIFGLLQWCDLWEVVDIATKGVMITLVFLVVPCL